MLVPYDDPQSNPFRIILPEMALKNDNLLSLLLAYSGTVSADGTWMPFADRDSVPSSSDSEASRAETENGNLGRGHLPGSSASVE